MAGVVALILGTAVGAGSVLGGKLVLAADTATTESRYAVVKESGRPYAPTSLYRYWV
ncbi:hypothetical protein ABLE92_19250 [Gordonia sp. VNQ95]|uniref:hypothetical protein n=1 Tax=Gordonia TaxID=2053 RepID=UPI0032B52D67